MNSRKRTYYFLLICIAGSILLVGALYFMSNDSRKNGFTRVFPTEPDSLVPEEILDIRHPGYYFSGKTDHHIFLGHLQAPAHILMTNPALTDTSHINMEIDILPEDVYDWKALQVVVDSPQVYLADGSNGLFLKTFLQDSSVDRYSPGSTMLFSGYIPLSPSSLVMKSYDPEYAQNILEKRSTTTKAEKKYILKKQVDGIFCTDGMLLYSRKHSHLFYLYYYRNQLLCLDTLLNEVYTKTTIDTVSHANIDLSVLEDSTQLTLGKPPLRVNKKSHTDGDFLYVNSALRADNESLAIFGNHSVIDLYTVTNGDYLFSFYIPEYRGKKMRDFLVLDTVLLALYDHHIITYSLNFLQHSAPGKSNIP